MTETPKKPPLDWNGIGRSPYFSIGIVFMAVSIVFFVNESMRTMAFAFLPLGIVFFSLAISGAGTGKDADGDATPGAGPTAPDAPEAPGAPSDTR